MKWKFWKSDADVEGAQRSLLDSLADLERARKLRSESESTAKRLQSLGKSNGFTEAIAYLYHHGAK